MDFQSPAVVNSQSSGSVIAEYCIGKSNEDYDRILEFWQLTSYIAISTEDRGGRLLHSALIVREKAGILLLGPSGVGKTTASLRVQAPWKSMSDDLAMVFKGQDGMYRAHPWPTWFHLLGDYAYKSWYIEKSYIIRGLYFAYQSELDRCTPIGPGEATAYLMESANQVGYNPRRTRTREQQLRQMDYLSELARSIPSYRLDISLDGEFWKLLK